MPSTESHRILTNPATKKHLTPPRTKSNHNLSMSPVSVTVNKKTAPCRNTNAAVHFIAVVSTNSQFNPGTSGTGEISADSSARLVSYMMGGPGRIPLSQISGFEPLHRHHQGQLIRHKIPLLQRYHSPVRKRCKQSRNCDYCTHCANCSRLGLVGHRIGIPKHMKICRPRPSTNRFVKRRQAPAPHPRVPEPPHPERSACPRATELRSRWRAKLIPMTQ